MRQELVQAVQSMPEHVKTGVDVIAIGSGLSALLGFLTTLAGLIAAIGSAVWIWWRIYDRYQGRR